MSAERMKFKPVRYRSVPDHTKDAFASGAHKSAVQHRLWCWWTWEGGAEDIVYLTNGSGNWWRAQQLIFGHPGHSA